MPLDLVTIVPVALWLAALASTVAGVVLRGSPSLQTIADELLRYLFIFPLGVQGLWAFAGHVFLPEETAFTIGWAPSPFQYEVGVANLGIALASFYAALKGFQARAGVAVAAACFLAGAGFGHILNILAGDTLTPGNSGPILVTDFLTPIVVLVLLIAFPSAGGAGDAAGTQPSSQRLQSRLHAMSSKPPAATAKARRTGSGKSGN